ncbi:hypothetical protein ABVK25_006779 [Lepraria finkii]|uniref:Uncharacterized protein n=1 Tax=Lepraria finkii TaxID=1340010 RepID=A0ABR4B4Z8_9LECA
MQSSAQEVMPDEDVKDGSDVVTHDGRSGPTPEEVARWRSEMVVSRNEPTGSDQSSSRFQARCFAVEWRDSVLLDGEELIRQLFGVLEGKEWKEGKVSFVLGMDVRKSRADYLVVVRSESRLRWRDWRKKLMFGHGGEGEGLFMRVRVPLRGSVEGTQAFVREMLGKCGTYEHIYRHKEADMLREHDKGYARSGRKRKAAEVDEA